MKPVPFAEVRRKLLAAGFSVVGQHGSHVKFGRRTEDGYITTTVPRHREVAAGTVRSILRQAGLTADEFEAL